MTSSANRTGRTTLTGDELILFDALFDVWDTLESLFPQVFRSSRNLPYSHRLDEAGVRAVVEGLLQRGLIQQRIERGVSRDATWLTLTAAGGNLWTLERQPIWERYCEDTSWPDEASDGHWLLSVNSPSLETARGFLGTAAGCGLYKIESAEEPTTIQPMDNLIPWRRFEAIHELRVSISSPGHTPVDWDRYRRERFWWRDVQELASIAR